MGNCLVAQSGGPTSVINATVAGIVQNHEELFEVSDVISLQFITAASQST